MYYKEYWRKNNEELLLEYLASKVEPCRIKYIVNDLGHDLFPNCYSKGSKKTATIRFLKELVERRIIQKSKHGYSISNIFYCNLTITNHFLKKSFKLSSNKHYYSPTQGIFISGVDDNLLTEWEDKKYKNKESPFEKIMEQIIDSFLELKKIPFVDKEALAIIITRPHGSYFRNNSTNELIWKPIIPHEVKGRKVKIK